VSATVLSVDRFGNVASNLRREHLEELGLSAGDRVELRLTFDRYYASVAETFADAPPGELILYEDSYGYMTVAISQGSAARLTGVHPGDALRVAVE
ncbi:MAG TPA: SAM hydroxide adenosyltransferase, partial [Gaiellaceae bacterium]|nr:SAM hydroxide adenosyltransferase [Gaiellaceae bacterium]